MICYQANYYLKTVMNIKINDSVRTRLKCAIEDRNLELVEQYIWRYLGQYSYYYQ